MYSSVFWIKSTHNREDQKNERQIYIQLVRLQCRSLFSRTCRMRMYVIIPPKLCRNICRASLSYYNPGYSLFLAPKSTKRFFFPHQKKYKSLPLATGCLWHRHTRVKYPKRLVSPPNGMSGRVMDTTHPVWGTVFPYIQRDGSQLECWINQPLPSSHFYQY